MHLSKVAQAQSPNAPHQKCHNSISLSRASMHSIDGNYVMETESCLHLKRLRSHCNAMPAQASEASQVSHVHATPM